MGRSGCRRAAEEGRAMKKISSTNNLQMTPPENVFSQVLDISIFNK
jgi:hypothetical protein